MDNITDEAYLMTIIMGIVKKPDEIEIRRTKDDMGILLALRVAKSDMGLVIGRKGVIATAIRDLVHMFGLNHGEKTTLKIEEPDEQER